MLARYRYRIEPTAAQTKVLARVFGSCRVVYNDALHAREKAFGDGITLSETEIQRRVITLAKRTEERSWLTEVPSVALIQSVRDAGQAYRNWFASIAKRRRGRPIGRPRYKSRKNTRQSFRLTRNGFSIHANGKLFLAKVGEVRVRWSRDLPSTPSSVTIIRESTGHYYATFVVDVPDVSQPLIENECGIDLGISRFASVQRSDGAHHEIPNPKVLRRKLGKLRRLEREKARRLQGSSNRAKSRRRIAALHDKIARTRRDHHHKQALALVRENQVIHVEDLNIAGMMRNRRLARAIADVGWGQFVQILGEKCAQYGRTLHRVSRWLPSSKACSSCQCVVDELPLEVRKWTCPGCNSVHDRDDNAARNILAAGRAERLNASGENRQTGVSRAGGDPVRPPMRRRGPMKQEAPMGARQSKVGTHSIRQLWGEQIGSPGADQVDPGDFG